MSTPLSGQIVPADTPQPSLKSFEEQQYRLEELTREVLELKLESLSEADERRSLVRELRGQVRLLSWILTVVLMVFGGALTWLILTQNAERAQLKQQLQAVTVTRRELEGLGEELKGVRAQLPDSLVQELKANQQLLSQLEQQFETIESNGKKLGEVDTQVQSLREQVETRQKALAVLSRAFQELIDEAPTTATPQPTPETSPQPSPSAP